MLDQGYDDSLDEMMLEDKIREINRASRKATGSSNGWGEMKKGRGGGRAERKKHRWSEVWQYFMYDEKFRSAICRHCNFRINFPNRQETTSLRRHIVKHHAHTPEVLMKFLPKDRRHPAKLEVDQLSEPKSSSQARTNVKKLDLSSQYHPTQPAEQRNEYLEAYINSQRRRSAHKVANNHYINPSSVVRVTGDYMAHKPVDQDLIKRRKSKIWTIFRPERERDGRKVGVCLICFLKLPIDRGTTELLRHVRKFHADVDVVRNNFLENLPGRGRSNDDYSYYRNEQPVSHEPPPQEDPYESFQEYTGPEHKARHSYDSMAPGEQQNFIKYQAIPGDKQSCKSLEGRDFQGRAQLQDYRLKINHSYDVQQELDQVENWSFQSSPSNSQLVDERASQLQLEQVDNSLASEHLQIHKISNQDGEQSAYLVINAGFDAYLEAHGNILAIFYQRFAHPKVTPENKKKYLEAILYVVSDCGNIQPAILAIILISNIAHNLTSVYEGTCKHMNLEWISKARVVYGPSSVYSHLSHQPGLVEVVHIDTDEKVDTQITDYILWSIMDSTTDIKFSGFLVSSPFYFRTHQLLSRWKSVIKESRVQGLIRAYAHHLHLLAENQRSQSGQRFNHWDGLHNNVFQKIYCSYVYAKYSLVASYSQGQYKVKTKVTSPWIQKYQTLRQGQNGHWECSCRITHKIGIPCAHIIKLYLTESIEIDLNDYVHTMWRHSHRSSHLDFRSLAMIETRGEESKLLIKMMGAVDEQRYWQLFWS